MEVIMFYVNGQETALIIPLKEFLTNDSKIIRRKFMLFSRYKEATRSYCIGALCMK